MAHVLLQLLFVLLDVLASLAVVQLLHYGLRLLAGRSQVIRILLRRMHRSFRAVVATATLVVGLHNTDMHGHWRAPILHLATLLLVGFAAWLATAVLFAIEDLALARFRTDVRDNRYARTVRTQITLVRRATAAAVTVIALGTMLLTFREVRVIGTSILASAGVAAAVAAFAAQAFLSNLIAGLQLAFGKSLRLDDVVVVENEWGRIEAITLTFVVVHIWDDRRLVFPTSYFTTKPFQNWTRSESSLLGSVEMEVDWSLPVEEMREELLGILADTQLWDKRIGVLQVTDAVHGLVRLRALVSAVDAGTLWDLRCHVRERLIGWLHHNHPEALPRQRLEMWSAPMRDTGPMPPHGTGEEGGARVFGGDAEGRERGNMFHGPDSTKPTLIDPSGAALIREPE